MWIDDEGIAHYGQKGMKFGERPGGRYAQLLGAELETRMDSEDNLAHYGVMGMKWGKRKGSLGSRAKGAALDFTQRRQSIAKRAMNGQSTREEKLYTAGARILLGKKVFHALAEQSYNKAVAQQKRIETGKLKARDLLVYANVTPLDLMVSRRDNKASHA